MDIENTLRDPRLDQRTCFLVSADDRAPAPAPARLRHQRRSIPVRNRPVVERNAQPRQPAVCPRPAREANDPRPPVSPRAVTQVQSRRSPTRARDTVGLLVFFWVMALSGSIAAIGTAMLTSGAP